MNQHQRIMEEIARYYEFLDEAVVVSPSSLAHRAFESFSTGKEEAHIQYASLEHFKQMSREFLRRRKTPDGEENEAHAAQGDLDLGARFSGKLQDRYPIPRQNGEEPAYKRRFDLTPEERRWNVRQLRRSAGARMEHADALEAEGQLVAAA
jgi:hypothetical protein